MVTITKQKRLDHRSCLIEFSSDLESPVFYIYIDGKLASVTEDTRYIAAVTGSDVVIEILDDADKVPMQIFPGRLRIGWFWVDGASKYLVEELVSESWIERSDVANNNGYMFYESRLLEDGSDHQFRITAFADDGSESEVANMTVFCVRLPDVPDIKYTYDESTATLTVSEAS